MNRISSSLAIVVISVFLIRTAVAANATDELRGAPDGIPGLALAAAQPAEQETVLQLYGELQPDSEHTAKLMTRMPGFVIDAPVMLGDRVAKNQILAKLTSYRLGEYYSQFNTAAEREQLALSEFKMSESLHRNNAVSEREYLRAKREYADAVIARQHAEALLNTYSDSSLAKSAESGVPAIRTDYYIRAPFAGTIISKDIYKGENFAEDSDRVFFTVSDLSSLYLDLRATATQLGELSAGMTARILPANTDGAAEGRVIYVAPVIDATTHTGLVRLLVPNQSGKLRPGQLASGQIKLPRRVQAATVITDAIQTVNGEPVVFVPSGEGFLPVKVKTGKSTGEETVILSGLNPGEFYVSRGAFELKSLLLTDGMRRDSHETHDADCRDGDRDSDNHGDDVVN
ncbi:MAG: efflux RND transporter periplasmic adaptor subunit [Victivallaceae bacterium]|nr:efflux RND transporter periplasmic adaptor subunit [Victivallaceae bacterium]